MKNQKGKETSTLSEDQKGVQSIIEKLEKAGAKRAKSDGSIKVRIHPDRK